MRASVVLALMACLVACTSSNSPAGTSAQSGGALTVRLSGDWQNFDFQGPQNSAQGQVVLAGYDRLVALDKNGQIIPYLAKSWKETATSITFQLVSGATCSDGTPVTPSVVVGSLQRWVDPATKSALIGRIMGPGPYSFTADDRQGTVTVTVGTAWSGLSKGFAAPNAGIVCPAGLTRSADPNSKMYGSGPFTLVNAVHNDSITFKARPEWKWGPAGSTAKSAGFPDTLIFKVLANDTTAANLLLTGGLDLGVEVGQEVPRLVAASSLSLVKTHSTTVYPIFFNHLAGHPTATDAIRQAIMTVIDQKAWNQAAYGGRGLISPTFIPVGGDCFDAATSKLLPTPSVQAAQSVLRDAGWTLTNGKLMKDGKPLTLSLIAWSVTGAGPEYLLNQLQQMGADASLQTLDVSPFVTDLRAGTFDVAATSSSASTGNPSWLVTALLGTFPPAGSNFSRIQNATAEAAYQSAISSSGKARCENWAIVQEALLKAHDYMPTASIEVDYFAKHGVRFVPYSDFVELYSLRKTAA